MNENEKNLFYRVLNDNITEEPMPELATNIMHMVHQKVQKKLKMYKTLKILGIISLGIIIAGFLYGYLFWYLDFKLPILNIGFEMPSRIYMIMMSVIFGFSLIELYFRKKLYERQ